jgi:hypothetical protein
MTLTNDSGVITITLADGTIAAQISGAADWNDTVAASIYTDTDGLQYRWDVPSQSFIVQGQ